MAHIATFDRLHNQHEGERLFVLATGPSLDLVSDKHLKALAGEWTIGVNTVAVYPRLPFMPTYYCVSEVGWLVDNVSANVHEQLAGKQGRVGQPRFKYYTHPFPMHDPSPTSRFYGRKDDYKAQIDGWVYVREDRDLSVQRGDFAGLGESFDYVPGGMGSVAIFAVMLGCWMGFEEIYLLGTDATREGHAKGAESRDDSIQRRQQDSFIRSAMTAERVMREAGRKLVNLSEGGDLTIARGKLDDILSN